MRPIERLLNKAENELQQEMQKQLDILLPAFAYVMWTEYGWRHDRIFTRLEEVERVWEECKDYGVSKSMMQMLEDETGIEIMLNGFEHSFHKFAYLDPAAWDGKLLPPEKMVYMRQRQKKWIAPQIISSLCLALHRIDDFGEKRISRFIYLIDKLRSEQGEETENYKHLIETETGLDVTEITIRRNKK